MKSVLDEINALDAVMGSFIFDEQGTIVSSQMPSIYTSQLETITQMLLRSFAPQQAEEPEWNLNKLYTRFDEGLLFLRFASGKFLFVLTEPSVKVPFLNIALNVATKRLKDTKKSTPPPPTFENSYSPEDFAASAASGQWPHTSSGHTWSLSQMAAPFGGTPPGAIGEKNVKRLTKAFAQKVGPVARVFMKKALQQLGAFPQTLTIAQTESLLSLLEPHLDTPQEREDFLRQARSILQQAGM